MEEIIKKFLQIGSGYGSGYGSGDGYGYGYGSGYGSGDGSGDGSGKNIREFAGSAVYSIDDIPTIIDRIHGSIANGRLIRMDLTTYPCYIARVGNSFAHGSTAREAYNDALDKDLQKRPVEERVAEFIAVHPDPDKEYGDLFKWHHILTGSCEFGRKEWCKQHGLMPSDSITVRSFLRDTCNDYGGSVIRMVAERMSVDISSAAQG